MELSVGMYVRAENGTIAKITKHEHYWINNEEWNYICTDIGCLIDIELIIKASHTLLGNDEEPCLIEEGDYVNGCLIVEITQDPFIKGQINLWTNMILSEGEPFPNEYYKAKILEKDIKSIVTKEQFESMSYKVED